MATMISRGDAVIVQQVTTLTPTVANSVLYDLLINSKTTDGYTSDGSATAQEIVEGVQAALDTNTKAIPELDEITFTENNTTVIGTGATTGEPFTVAEGPGAGNWASITTGTVAKSPNHWIAENFTGGVLPANSDTVYIQGLSSSQSIKWGLDQSAVLLTNLYIQADSQAQIGLPEIHPSTNYYEYRDTHLKIGATNLIIGDGQGLGSGRIKVQLGATTCNATIYKTGTPADQDEGAVHLAGGDGSSTLQMFAGTVDLAMLPGYTGQWATVVVSGGLLRCGAGVTLATVEAAGGTVETRAAVTTLRTRNGGRVIHSGAGNITTADIQGGSLKVRATGTLTITTLNLYGGKTLDLSECDSLVTVTNMTVYATPDNQARIVDPNNKLVMSNPASTPNGVHSLVVTTGSGRNVRVT